MSYYHLCHFSVFLTWIFFLLTMNYFIYLFICLFLWPANFYGMLSIVIYLVEHWIFLCHVNILGLCFRCGEIMGNISICLWVDLTIFGQYKSNIKSIANFATLLRQNPFNYSNNTPWFIKFSPLTNGAEATLHPVQDSGLFHVTLLNDSLPSFT